MHKSKCKNKRHKLCYTDKSQETHNFIGKKNIYNHKPDLKDIIDVQNLVMTTTKN